MRLFSKSASTPDVTLKAPAALRKDAVAQLVDQASAVIHFTTDGTIVHANENFLAGMGYTAQELTGQHHRIFVDPAFANSPAYKTFWNDLAMGKVFTSRISRFAKDGTEVWLQATYGPVKDPNGKVVSIVKVASLMVDVQDSVAKLNEAMLALDRGDLTHRTTVSADPHLSRLGGSFNAAMEKLGIMIGNTKAMSVSVTQGAERLQVSAEDMAHHAQDVDDAISRSTDAIQDLSGQAVKSARTANDIDAVTSRTRAAAEANRGVVDDAIGAMERIENFSGEISKMVAVIDDISFQTNLLALNAGVEAARAGDAGRGFAVVAEEVRGLAQRAAESASQIKLLIADSSQGVSNGVGLVRQAGTELSVIFEGLDEIALCVPQIAEGAHGQAAMLEDVTKALGSIRKLSSDTARSMDQNRDIGATLSAQSNALTQELLGFETGPSHRRRAA